MGCIKYQYNSLEENVKKIVVATSYEAGWIGDTLHDIHGQKIWQYNIQNAKILQWKSDSEIHRPASDLNVHWKLINLHSLSSI